MGVFVDANNKERGFLRTATGAFTTIDVPGATSTDLSGINDTGQIVGYFTGANGKQLGFLRTTTGALITIDVPGALGTFARGINDAGQIVGHFSDASFKAHGFVTTQWFCDDAIGPLPQHKHYSLPVIIQTGFRGAAGRAPDGKSGWAPLMEGVQVLKRKSWLGRRWEPLPLPERR